jgi:hypothetical protein
MYEMGSYLGYNTGFLPAYGQAQNGCMAFTALFGQTSQGGLNNLRNSANDLNSVEKRQAADAFTHLSTQCQNAIASHGINLSAVATSISSIYFVSVYIDGATLVSWFVPGAKGVPTGTTVAGYQAPGNAAQVIPTPSGSPSNYIILYAPYFSSTAPVQNTLLVHEVLHVGTGLDDIGLASKLGLGTFTDPLAASKAISDWLGYTNCAPVQ